MTAHTAVEDLDGRRRRTERSKTAIAKAVLDMVLETGEPPTAEAIAGRANVSRRSVFRLFEQMDDLYAEVIELTQAKALARLEAPGLAGLPLDQRVTGFVERLTTLYEDIAPMRRLAERLRSRHSVIDARLCQDARDLARYGNALFRSELKGEGAERDATSQALALALSWQAWEALRATQGLSVKKSREVVQKILTALL